MAIIKHKRSSVQDKVPTTDDIQLGELCINTYNGRLWFKKVVSAVHTLVEVFTTQGGTLLGFLTLHADPTNIMHAATKQYVDNHTTYLYDSTGLVSTKTKIWVGTVSSTSGLWTADYSTAGFSVVKTVTATGQATGTGLTARNFASVRHSTITTTSCSGTVSNALEETPLFQQGRLINSPNGTLVEVVVIGY